MTWTDDTILIADTLLGLQKLVDVVPKISAEYGINIICKKNRAYFLHCDQ